MSGSGGVSTSRFEGENRFYCTPARRHERLQQQQKQQQQQLLIQQQLQLESLKTQLVEVENRSDDSTSEPCSLTATNLDSFLESTTPFVPVHQHLGKNVRGYRNGETESNPYFVLGDLWESFKEWSAYGAGVPLVLSDNDSVVQYYVPYLSAIQLYVNPSKPTPKFQRRPGEDSDVESSRESSSNGSHSSETDSSKNILDSSSSEGGDDAYPPGLLKFQYFEKDSPYSREPLADKILDLATRFPELETYKSSDLLPSSWMSVAWYPIYRIPMGPTLQDLDACFLTFHSLSTPLNSTGNGVMDGSSRLSLPIFGLASYKFNGTIWAPNGHYEVQRTNSLLQAADNWLRRLQVDHPDYRFFVSRTTFQR
ncbi:hypothetical protein ACHQM5_026385 [Ranunculus cassubicifolius]